MELGDQPAEFEYGKQIADVPRLIEAYIEATSTPHSRYTFQKDTFTIFELDSREEAVKCMDALGYTDCFSSCASGKMGYGLVGIQSNWHGKKGRNSLYDSLEKFAERQEAEGTLPHGTFQKILHEHVKGRNETSVTSLRLIEAQLYLAVHGRSLPATRFTTFTCKSAGQVEIKSTRKTFTCVVHDLVMLSKLLSAASKKGVLFNVCSDPFFDPIVRNSRVLFVSQLLTIGPVWGELARQRNGAEVSPEVRDAAALLLRVLTVANDFVSESVALGAPKAVSPELLSDGAEAAWRLAERARDVCLVFLKHDIPLVTGSQGQGFRLESRPGKRVVGTSRSVVETGGRKCPVSLRLLEAVRLDGSTAYLVRVAHAAHTCKFVRDPVKNNRMPAALMSRIAELVKSSSLTSPSEIVNLLDLELENAKADLARQQKFPASEVASSALVRELRDKLQWRGLYTVDRVRNVKKRVEKECGLSEIDAEDVQEKVRRAPHLVRAYKAFSAEADEHEPREFVDELLAKVSQNLLHGSIDSRKTFTTALIGLLQRSGNEVFCQAASDVNRKMRRKEDELLQSATGKFPRQASSNSSAASICLREEGTPPDDPESRPASRQPSNAFEFLQQTKSHGQRRAEKQAGKRWAEDHAEQLHPADSTQHRNNIKRLRQGENYSHHGPPV